jgi:hypothetical protein
VEEKDLTWFYSSFCSAALASCALFQICYFVLFFIMFFTPSALKNQACCDTQPTMCFRWAFAEKLLVILRDGRKLVGTLRSFDQFGT